MKIQVVEDSKGKATGVFIPISDWAKLKKRHKELAELESNSSASLAIKELKEALIELRLVEQGKLKARPVQDLLDEL